MSDVLGNEAREFGWAYETARFRDQVGTHAHKAGGGTSHPAVHCNDEDDADSAIGSISALETHLGHLYRRLPDVFCELPRICYILE